MNIHAIAIPRILICAVFSASAQSSTLAQSEENLARMKSLAAAR
ncbi:MAG TPA: hypothetical protein PLK77_07300 [Pyrinomonadaceae bacterium]|nr:hypothetical protein [Pyrinomonadaceae bacterium]